MTRTSVLIAATAAGLLAYAVRHYRPLDRLNATLRRHYGGEIHAKQDNWRAEGLDFRNVTVVANKRGGLIEDCIFSGRTSSP